jgi:hypothetical protein
MIHIIFKENIVKTVHNNSINRKFQKKRKKKQSQSITSKGILPIFRESDCFIYMYVDHVHVNTMYL